MVAWLHSAWGRPCGSDRSLNKLTNNPLGLSLLPCHLWCLDPLLRRFLGVLQGQSVCISPTSKPPTPPHHKTAGTEVCLPWALLNHLPPLHLLSRLVCCGLGSQVSPGFFEEESLCFCFVFSLLSWLLFSKGRGQKHLYPGTLRPESLPYSIAYTSVVCGSTAWQVLICSFVCLISP